MSTRSRVPFNIRSRLAFAHEDPIDRRVLAAALTLGEYDGQLFALDPGGATRVVTLWNESAEDTNGAKCPLGAFVEILNEADAAEDLTIQPVIGSTRIDMSAVPTATDTVTIAGLVFEFLASGATVASDTNIGVLIGATAKATIDNFVSAINGTVTSATGILKSDTTAADRNNATVPFVAARAGTFLVLKYAGTIGGQATSGCSLDLSTNPTTGNTVVIGADTYQFRASGANVTNDAYIGVALGSTAALTLVNFIAAINGTATSSGLYKTDGTTPSLYKGTEYVYGHTYAGSLLWIYECDAAGGACATKKASIALSDTLTAAVNWSAANCNIGPASSVTDTLTSGVSWTSATVVATETIHTIHRGEWAKFVNAGPCWFASGYTAESAFEDIVLPATTDITVSAGGVATLTESVHTVRGAGGLADNLDTIAGLSDSGLGFLVCGAEAITVRDAATGGGNIVTDGNTSLVLAAGDVVQVFRTGSAYHVTPLSITAGLPVGKLALARGYIIVGNASGIAAALDGGAAQGVFYSDGNDVLRGTIAAHGASTSTTVTTGITAASAATASATTGITAASAATASATTGITAASAATASATTGITAAGAATGADGTGATGDATVAEAPYDTYTAPAAADTVIVHASFEDNAASPITTGITNPAIPRNLNVAFGASWAGGDLTFVGTDQFDAAVTETIADNPGNTVAGVKIFKTVTSIAIQTGGPGGAGHTAEVGVGLKLGLSSMPAAAVGWLTCDGTGEVGTWDATYGAVTTTTAPNGAHNYAVMYPSTSTHSHTGPSHTHTAGAISVTDGGHSHTAGAVTVTDGGHSHTAGSVTVTDGGHSHTAGAITVTDGGHAHSTTPPAHSIS